MLSLVSRQAVRENDLFDQRGEQERQVPIWAIGPIEDRPQVALESWAVFEVPLNGVDQPWTRHLAGFAVEDRQGQVSSPVTRFDPVSGQGVTRSGRVYRLLSRPGLNSDALYVWDHWKSRAGVTEERDVTAEVRMAMEAAQAPCATKELR